MNYLRRHDPDALDDVLPLQKVNWTVQAATEALKPFATQADARRAGLARAIICLRRAGVLDDVLPRTWHPWTPETATEALAPFRTRREADRAGLDAAIRCLKRHDQLDDVLPSLVENWTPETAIEAVRIFPSITQARKGGAGGAEGYLRRHGLLHKARRSQHGPQRVHLAPPPWARRCENCGDGIAVGTYITIAGRECCDKFECGEALREAVYSRQRFGG